MSIFQTEAGLVSFCHFGAIQIQQIIVSENLHTVVMSGGDETTQCWKYPLCPHKYVRHAQRFEHYVFEPAPALTQATVEPAVVDAGNVLPVTLVPDPGLVTRPRPEICLPVVLDLRGESEEAAVGAGVGVVGALGQALLLQGTLQHVHGSVLQVGGLFNNLGIQNQIWGTWDTDTTPRVQRWATLSSITKLIFTKCLVSQ